MGCDDLVALLRSGPFHLALRAAIEARGLGLQRIQVRLAEQGLHVGVATLSYWQQGRRRPERRDSLRAVTALEEILGLPPAALTVLLGLPRPRGRVAGMPTGARRYSELISSGPVLDRLFAELDCPQEGRTRTVSLFEDVEIGPDRSSRRRRCLQVLRAYEEVDRHVVVYQGDEGCDSDRVEVAPLANCRLGRTRRDPGSGIVVAELLLGRTLRTGETHILEYEHRDASSVVCHSYHRGTRFPGGRLVIQVRFTPTALPARCHSYAQRYLNGPDTDRVERQLDAHHAVHLVAVDAAPGIVGIRWDW